jgi:hypothetical protein
MSTDRRRLTRHEKRWFALFGCLVALLVLGSYWWHWINTDPEINIPTPKMPNPNAFDYYVKAGNAVAGANQIKDTIWSKSPSRLSTASTVSPHSSTQIKTLLQKNAQALRFLRRGFAYKYWQPPVRSNKAWTPYLSSFSGLARLLVMESRAYAENDHWVSASRSTLDILRLGTDVPHGALLHGALRGYNIQAFGRRELWQILPHLNAGTARAIARELEKLYERRVACADILKEDKWFGQAVLLEIMDRGDWRGELGLPGGRNGDRWPTFYITKRGAMNNYSTYMDVLIANARRPYNAPQQPLPKLVDLFTATLAPVSDRFLIHTARNDTGNALLLVALALRAFRLEHNVYPTNLTELMPAYLKRIPADPFGGGEPLRYRREGSTYVLWSIGPDGVDNKGRAIDSMVSGASESKRRWALPESKGDMVAGINR